MRMRWFDSALDTLPRYPHTPFAVVAQGDAVSYWVSVREPWGAKSIAFLTLTERDGVPMSVGERMVVRHEA
jgi:hypothetical protein